MKKLPFENVRRKILVKRQSMNTKDFGCNPEERPVEDIINYGIVNIDKPKGPTKLFASEVPIRFQTMFKKFLA